MPNITRASAQSLLNKREMSLYDDSRLNALRKLDPAGIARRIGLAREARDRARDLLQRQKLALRAATGSKRGSGGAANQRSKDKVEVLADILSRFKEHAPIARKRASAAAAESKASTRKPAVRKATGAVAKKTGAAKKATTKKKAAPRSASKTTAPGKVATSKKAPGKAASKNPASRKSGTGDVASKKATPGKVAPRKTAQSTGKAATPSDGRGPAKAKAAPKKLTARQALANTRKLLRAKQAEARAPKPWQSIGGSAGAGQVSPDGHQSPEAAVRAAELHEAEMHRPAQLGAISSHVRRAQGRRDNRGGSA